MYVARHRDQEPVRDTSNTIEKTDAMLHCACAQWFASSIRILGVRPGGLVLWPAHR